VTVLAQPHRPTDEPGRAAATRDLQAWESRVRRILRPSTVELVDGSREQRQRLVATGVRRGTFRAPAELPGGADPSAPTLDELLAPDHRDLRDVDAAAGPGTPEPLEEELREAAALRAMTGAARGRTAWLVPFAVDGSGASGPELGVLLTDSLVAVLALEEEAQVGPVALARIGSGEPWTALVHSVGLPLDDEQGLPLRDDAAWPEGPTRLRVRLRGGSEVWSCGSPVAWA
jgi:GTP-dependent phosphoenolpyruvate carboxykinase